ncbi:hypothetical protein Tco_0228005 [Tanacetum coccineum]
MTTLVIDLSVSHPVSTTIQAPLPTSTTKTTTTITTTTLPPPPPPQPQQSTTGLILLQRIGELEQYMVDLVGKAVDDIVTDDVDWAMQAPLRARFSDPPAVDMKEILQQRMFEDKSYEAHEDHKNLFDALQKSLERDYSNQLLADLDEARRKKRKRRESPRTPPGSPPSQPPPPHPPAGVSGALGTLGASGSSQLPSAPPPQSTETNQGKQQQGSGSTGVSAGQDSSPTYSMMNDDSIPDEQWKPLPEEERPATPEHTWTIPSSNVLDVENNWATALFSTYATPTENSLLAKTGGMTTFMNWYCCQVNKTVLIQADFEGHEYEVTNPESDQVRIDVNRPLSLGGPTGHVTIHTQFFFNKDLEYLRYGNKGSRPALSISKMKAASYPDFGLELLVPEQMWIDDVCTYDISDKYGISHWCFNRQKFYIDRHDSLSLRKEVRTRMRILSVRVEDFQLSIESYQTQLNLTKPGWDATGYKFKHDYTIIESPRAVVFSVNNNERKIMQLNEIYKFSDGTLTRILEALDYRATEDEGSIRTWNALLVDVFVTTDFFKEQNDIKEYYKNKGIVQTKMELVLEHTQQGTSNEVSWVFNSLVHSLRALSTLRGSGLRTASTAVKPYQGDS